ncbi:MAG: hypothetical protein A2Y07_00180 [Planctomycetes bacterium GWF2_50_10]|nr:MAG: hypothetical protein A2Y07_00180 [Planctomycetes bacterium GWF2_50_10]
MALRNLKSSRKYELNNLVEAFTILSKIFDSNESLGLTQLSDDTHISKNKTFRLLSTFEQFGIVEKNEKSKYKIGIATIGIARNIMEKSSVRDAIRPYMEGVVKAVNEAVYFACYMSGGALLVDYVDCLHPVKATSLVGRLLPLPTRAKVVNKCKGSTMLADIAIDVGGLDIDITTVSIPFINDLGIEIGALVVLAPNFRMSRERIDTEIAPALKEVMRRQALPPTNVAEDMYRPSAHPVEREYGIQSILFTGMPQQSDKAILVARS